MDTFSQQVDAFFGYNNYCRITGSQLAIGLFTARVCSILSKVGYETNVKFFDPARSYSSDPCGVRIEIVGENIDRALHILRTASQK